MKHLCVVIEKYTGKEIDAFEITDADCWFFARHRARELFEEKLKYTPSLRRTTGEWYVDSCEIED